jgi:hypothetical protein
MRRTDAVRTAQTSAPRPDVMARRSVLLAGLGLTAGLVAGNGATLPTSASVTDRFDIRIPSRAPSFLTAFPRLISPNVMQYAVQDTNSEWYVSQATDGTGPAETTMITRLNANGGIISAMALQNAGHGVPIQLQHQGGALWVWTPFATVDSTGTVTRKELVRVRWRDNVTQHRNDPVNVRAVPTFTRSLSLAALDLRNGTVAIRTTHGSGTAQVETYRRRKIAEMLAGIDRTYGSIGPLSCSLDSGGHIMQGFALRGDTLLRLTGTGDGRDPTVITAYSFATEQEWYRKDLGNLGASRWGHEPEGLAFLTRPGFEDVLTVGFSQGPEERRTHVLYAFNGDPAGTGGQQRLTTRAYRRGDGVALPGGVLKPRTGSARPGTLSPGFPVARLP